MRVRRIDQNSAALIDTFQRFRHARPIYSENDDVALGRLLPGTCDGSWAKIGNKISQCLRPSGIGYDYGMTRDDQVATDRTRNFACTYKSYFHDQSPFASTSE
jgi:hypothetical protein